MSEATIKIVLECPHCEREFSADVNVEVEAGDVTTGD